MRWRAERGERSARGDHALDGAGAGDRRSDQDANLQVDRKAAAIMLNVSERSVASAETVRDKATPELQAEVERRIAAGEILSAAEVKKLKQQAHRLVAATVLAREPAAVPFTRSSLNAAALWWADGDTTWADANRSVGVESLAVELLATVPIVAVVAVPPDLNIDAWGHLDGLGRSDERGGR
jgi:hypothetical protein